MTVEGDCIMLSKNNLIARKWHHLQNSNYVKDWYEIVAKVYVIAEVCIRLIYIIISIM